MITTKRVPLSVIFSVISGRLFCKTVAEMGLFLEWYTGHESTTINVGQLADNAIPFIYQEYPQLSEINFELVNKDNFLQFLSEYENIYGKYLTLTQIGN